MSIVLGNNGGVGGLPPLFDVLNVYLFLEFVEFLIDREGVIVVVHIHVASDVNEVESHCYYLFELTLAAAVAFLTCSAWTAEAEDFGWSAVARDDEGTTRQVEVFAVDSTGKYALADVFDLCPVASQVVAFVDVDSVNHEEVAVLCC